MKKFFLYLKTATFFKNIFLAIFIGATLLFIAFYSLRFYTKHGEGIAVPELKGLSIENAVKILKAQGFKYRVDSIYMMDKEPGTVVEQDPDPNTNVKVNRTIYLTIITKDTPEINFPDISGMTFLEARSVLLNYGLKLGDTSYIADINRDRIVVARFGGEIVQKNDRVLKGSKINLVLGDGMGASEVDIPDLRGLTLSEALFSIRGASLRLGSVSYRGVADTATAKIIAQSPSLTDSVTKVNIGTAINVVLSNSERQTNDDEE